jgi:hypothetical protein
MQLALRLGRTLDELGRTMSAREFALWLALYRRAPWDDTRADLGFAIVSATIANYAGKVRAKEAKPAAPADFMPFARDPEPEVEEEPDVFTHFSQFQ